MRKLLISIILLAFNLTFFATVASAETSGLVPCGNESEKGVTTDPCTFDYLVILVRDVINFLIFKIAAPLGAIMFAYAGYTYITNGGNESKIKEAHSIFLGVFWGLVLALASWLIVNFILTFFLLDDSPFNFLGP